MNRGMALAEWRRGAKALGAAEVLLKSDYREDSVSRSYYAILHAAKSALFVHDISTSSHAAVRIMFGLHLVRSGEIERTWAGHLAEAMDDRLIADYEVYTHFSSDEVRSEHERAKAFVNRIRRYLLASGLTEQELEPERDDVRDDIALDGEAK